MNKVNLNEDVENVVKSFIPNIVRLNHLREKYTNEFLIEKLNKKTDEQISLIQEHLNVMVRFTGELQNIRVMFNTVGLDIDGLKSEKIILYETLYKWCYDMKKKDEKVKNIINFIQRADDIVNEKSIEVIIREDTKISLINKFLVKEKQSEVSAKVLKILLLLVSILKK